MWNTLTDAGEHGQRILGAYIAKEKIRDVLALSPARTHLTPAPSQIRHRLGEFFTCAPRSTTSPRPSAAGATRSPPRYSPA